MTKYAIYNQEQQCYFEGRCNGKSLWTENEACAFIFESESRAVLLQKNFELCNSTVLSLKH